MALRQDFNQQQTAFKYATRGSGISPIVNHLEKQPWEFNFNFRRSMGQRRQRTAQELAQNSQESSSLVGGFNTDVAELPERDDHGHGVNDDDAPSTPIFRKCAQKWTPPDNWTSRRNRVTKAKTVATPRISSPSPVWPSPRRTRTRTRDSNRLTKHDILSSKGDYQSTSVQQVKVPPLLEMYYTTFGFGTIQTRALDTSQSLSSEKNDFLTKSVDSQSMLRAGFPDCFLSPVERT